MNRRRFLGGLASLGTASAAGCIGATGGGVPGVSPDSDGDGVPDHEDYAPRDAAVQEKSDVLAQLAAASEDAPTTTARAGVGNPPTRESHAAVKAGGVAPPSHSLRADDPPLDHRNYIEEYSLSGVTVRVNAAALGVPYERCRVVAGLFRYPRGEVLSFGVSEAFGRDTGSHRFTVDVSTPGSIVHGRLHFMAFVTPADEDVEPNQVKSAAFVHETDAFRMTSGQRLAPAPPGYQLPADATDNFERHISEGAYELRFRGETRGKAWWTELYVWKAAYAAALREPRGRSYDGYVPLAREHDTLRSVANVLDATAASLGFETRESKLAFCIDFVQSLPYVTDDEAKGSDEYVKTVTETLCEASGDCEDTSILLAALLQAEPFGYDTVLVRFDDHVGVGVYGDENLPGYYWPYDGRRYYYVETTGEGWGVGDLPRMYVDADARVFQV